MDDGTGREGDETGQGAGRTGRDGGMAGRDGGMAGRDGGGSPGSEGEARSRRPGPSPVAEYTLRLEARRGLERRLARRELQIANGRLAVFLAGAALFWAAGWREASYGWMMLPLALFIALAVIHQRTRREKRHAGRGAAFYERGLKRLRGEWAGTGATGERFLEPSHPYAVDLDLFGKGSLFELLCAARTSAGERCLADWLMAPAGPDELRARQAAVAELRGRLELREDLAVLGEEVRHVLEGDALATWGAAPRLLTSSRLRLLTLGLPLVAIVALVLWVKGHGGAFFGGMVLAEMLFFRFMHPQVQQVLHHIDRRSRDLTLLSQVLERLEAEQFTSPRLAALRSALDRAGKPPSRRIASLRRLVELLESEKNQLFAPFALLLLWRIQLAFALERWRAANGPDIGVWLRAIGELEALSALAGYAWERPDDPFPEIESGAPCFLGEGLCHPLLPPPQAVRNDLRLGRDRRLLLVSGSNMSGKSTLLRTVGSNAVLALAGAPVRARRLRLTPLQVGASIRTQDSLLGGTSRFYAEISRIRQVVGLADGDLPLLFLLDEILHGTNSHDRRIGAEAIVRALSRRGAIGLVTTHDLALARIVEDPTLGAGNVHFEDQLLEGRMHFDYRLREGVVEKSNAIELMRAVGLEV